MVFTVLLSGFFFVHSTIHVINIVLRINSSRWLFILRCSSVYFVFFQIVNFRCCCLHVECKETFSSIYHTELSEFLHGNQLQWKWSWDGIIQGVSLDTSTIFRIHATQFHYSYQQNKKHEGNRTKQRAILAIILKHAFLANPISSYPLDIIIKYNQWKFRWFLYFWN